MNVLSIHDQLPRGLFFLYVDESNGTKTVSINREPIVAHSDEDPYEIICLTNSFVGLLTVDAIINYLTHLQAANWINQIKFHVTSEVEFYMLELEAKMKGDA